MTRGLASYTETDEVGVYRVITSRGETRVAVNIGTADESDLTPGPCPPSWRRARPEVAPVPVQRELWPYFVTLRAGGLRAARGFLYWRRQTGGRLVLPFSPGERWALGLRCVLLAVLVVALARPTVPRWVDRLNVLFLLDVSDSVSLAARENAFRFAAQAAQSHAAGRSGRPHRLRRGGGGGSAAPAFGEARSPCRCK